MYNLQFKPKSDFAPYWFIRQGITDRFDIFLQQPNESGKINPVRIGMFCSPLKDKNCITIDENFTDYNSLDFDAISNAFNDFFNRPEFIVGIPVPQEIINETGTNAATFEKLIVGCLLLQYEDDAKALKIAKKFLDWLRDTDFYTAPGSTRFHDAEPEGLLKHSLRVVNNAIMLMKLRKFADVVPHEAILCAEIHDVSKVGVYEHYMRNVKDDATGIWSQVPSYRYKTSEYPFGHSTASMYLGQKFFPDLSMEQVLALRHHMYFYGIAQSETSDLSDACSRYPLVHLIQWSDQSSITLYQQEA